MNNNKYKIKIVGYYIKPNRHRPSKGVVYNSNGIAPCITDYSLGGNLVPTIVVEDNHLKSKTNMEQTKSSKIELPEELKGKKFRIRNFNF